MPFRRLSGSDKGHRKGISGYNALFGDQLEIITAVSGLPL